MSKNSEQISFIELDKLIPFRDHPFQVKDEQGYEVFSEELYTNKDGGNDLQTVGGMGETQKFIKKILYCEKHI